MFDHFAAAPRKSLWYLCALSCLSGLTLGAGAASALPRVQVDPAPGFLLAQAAKPGGQESSEQPMPAEAPASSADLTDLNEVLEATQARLEELFSATAALAERREELEGIKQENERLAAALQQANARRTELARSREDAEARIAELTKAVDVAVREAARIDEELSSLRRDNADLEERLARTDNARGAVEAELERVRGKLEEATGPAEQLEAELTDVRAQLERAEQQGAQAESAREEAAARATAMEHSAKRADAEAERLAAELAAVKEQLGQTATAAVEAERARQSASGTAEQLQGEVDGARQELAAAKSEVDRFRTANTELEKEVASLRADSQSAMEAARRNLVVMEEKIDVLNAALARAGLGEAMSPRKSPSDPAGLADEGASTTGSQSAMAAPTPESAEETGDGQGTDGARELALVGSAKAPSTDDGSGLERFTANVEYLNSRAKDAAGSDLFSGVEADDDGVVHVGTTRAWANIPPAGQQSYLNSLLDLWIVAQDGDRPVVVRIVDSNGQVLLEKSGSMGSPPAE